MDKRIRNKAKDAPYTAGPDIQAKVAEWKKLRESGLNSIQAAKKVGVPEGVLRAAVRARPTGGAITRYGVETREKAYEMFVAGQSNVNVAAALKVPPARAAAWRKLWIEDGGLVRDAGAMTSMARSGVTRITKADRVKAARQRVLKALVELAVLDMGLDLDADALVEGA